MIIVVFMVVDGMTLLSCTRDDAISLVDLRSNRVMKKLRLATFIQLLILINKCGFCRCLTRFIVRAIAQWFIVRAIAQWFIVNVYIKNVGVYIMSKHI